MNSFSDDYLNNIKITQQTLSAISALSEYKGKEALYARTKQSREKLNKLIERAKVQSVESSNRIEGIDVKHDRVVDIVEQQSAPRNRPEEEVAGYRDALAYIHENYKAVPVSQHTIAMFHEFLYKYTSQRGGEYKWEDNLIIDRMDGETRVRFTPPPSSQTYLYIQNLVNDYQFVLKQRNLSPLVLIPLFVLDYLCIHPFTDGNGRTARLWTLLLLYQSGFSVGRYISLERIIEESKETYYESLEKSSQGWKEGNHNVTPWFNYFYGVLMRAYKELDARVGNVDEMPKTDQVKEYVSQTDRPFAMKEVEEKFPNINRNTIRLVLRELRDEGKIAATGHGRGAKWTRKG